MTDKQMLQLFLTKHDEQAFEGLVLRHGPMVLGLCRQILRDAHEAEDAFQSTFLLLARNAATIRNFDSVGSWLYGVAYRIAMRAKTGARRRAQEGRNLEMAIHQPDDELERRELQPILHDEVNSLPEKYRAPIILCFFEGQTHEEAAQQLACPTGTVKGRMARAKEMLRSRLERRGRALSLGLIVLLLTRDARADVPDELVESTVDAAIRETTTAALTAIAESRPIPWPRLVISAALILFALAFLGWIAGDRSRLSASIKPLANNATTIPEIDPRPAFSFSSITEVDPRDLRGRAACHATP